MNSSAARRRPRAAGVFVAFAALAGCLSLFAACAARDPAPGASAATSRSDTTRADVAKPPARGWIDAPALLLLLEDRRLYEGSAIRPLLDADVPTRVAVALALGRIGDAKGLPDLEFLAGAPEAEVRSAAAFAFGLLPAPAAGEATRPVLARLATDADRAVALAALEALGKQGAELDWVDGLLGGLPPAERWQRLLPNLYRFRGESVVLVARRGLAEGPADLQFWAAYALCRRPLESAHADIRALTHAPDPWVRAQAGRALGLLGDATNDQAVLRQLIDDAEPAPVIHALRAMRRWVAEGKLAPPDSWRAKLRALIDDPRPGVPVTAIEAAGAWLLDPALETRLQELANAGGPRGEAALAALAQARVPAARSVIVAWSRSAEPTTRARAAEAAVAADLPALVTELAGDKSAVVRAAVLGARLGASSGEARRAIATAALGDEDPFVRAAAVEPWVEDPALEIRVLNGHLTRAADDPAPDAAMALVRAIEARAQARVEEREAGRQILLGLVEQSKSFLLRREALRALSTLGVEEAALPALGPATNRDLADYRDIVERTREPRRVDLRTARGVVRLELDCPAAPLTCLNFLQLAAQGYFDGIAFHRVVPDFVAQAGDPRGDGSGGPGYEIRDEINRLRYVRGAVGMALSGPDTGGSQFFLMLSRAPHLDGGYTVFGRVIEGLDVADRLEQGDRIQKAVVLPADRRVATSAPSPAPAAVSAAAAPAPHAFGAVERALVEVQHPEFRSTGPEVEPAPAICEQLARVPAGARIDVYFGTWCGDSRREVTRFWNALDRITRAAAPGARLPFDLHYVAVDRSKQEPAELLTGVELKYVPTFVVTRQGREVGRVVESAPEGIEKALLDLLSGARTGVISGRPELASAATLGMAGRR
jgi:cyclophilin family peptidyl-prolyl cis-trans isomerase/HEAT repeat protein